MAKKLSLADRIREKRKSNRSESETTAEKELVSTIRALGDSENHVSDFTQNQNMDVTPIPQTNSNKDQDHIRIISGSDQEQITKGSDKDQINIRYVSGKEHQKGSPKDHQKASTSKKAKRITKGSPSVSLSKSQTKLYLWFKDRGQTGVFNKPEIERTLSMPYITIRKAIKKLERVGVIELQYDSCQKIYEYRIENEQILKLSKNITIGSGSYQDQNKIISPSLNSSSSSIKKTTTEKNSTDTEKIIAEIMESDPEYTYWQEQQVTPKQVVKWKKEFGIDLETILSNLCFTRWQILKQGSDIRKSPAHYIYGTMKRNGGTVNKPAGYKSMSQIDLEYFEKWKKQREEHAQKIELIKNETLKNQIDPKIDEILANPDIDNEYLKAALKKIKTRKRQQTIISMIESGQSLGDESKSVLRAYLENILAQEVLERM
jgi:hypothetical protein